MTRRPVKIMQTTSLDMGLGINTLRHLQPSTIASLAHIAMYGRDPNFCFGCGRSDTVITHEANVTNKSQFDRVCDRCVNRYNGGRKIEAP